MSRNRLLRPAAHALLLGTAAMLGMVPSYAEGRPISLELSEAGGYGRIVATWADGSEDGPDISTRLSGSVLVMRFDEPVSIDLDALKEGLPSYVAIARQSDDEQEIRIALAREYRIHQSESYDLTAVDLLPENRETDPADIVSPLVAIKRNEAAAAAAAAEAARLAAIPPPLDLTVQTADVGSGSTLTFYWPETVGFEASATDSGYQIRFDRRGVADLAHVRIDPPVGMTGIRADNTEDQFVVDIDEDENYWANAVAADNAVVVRFHEGQRPPDGIADDPLIPDALKALAADLPPEKGVEPPSRKPVDLGKAMLVVEDAEGEPVLASASEPETAVAQSFTSELPDITPPRVWREALPTSGRVPVSANSLREGLEVKLSFASEIPGVVFRRHEAIWIAFPANGDFDFAAARQATGVRMDQVQSETGMALRIFLPRDELVQVTNAGRVWNIEIGNQGSLADRQIKPARIASEGGSGIQAIVPDAATLFRLQDPEIGDELILVAAHNPSTALVQSLSFVEAEFPVTTHGLVIAPRTDDLNVVQRDDTVLISREAGLALSSWGVDSVLAGQGNLSPGFLDFGTWRQGSENEFWRNQTRLAAAAAQADPEQWDGQKALLDLARFYLAWEFAAEAYGPLNIALSADPLLEQDAQWLTLKGAADIMSGRYFEAIEALDHSSSRNDPASAAWLGLAYSRIGEWRKARQSFIQADSLINAHTPEWAARFNAAAARAMIRMGDGGTAEKMALAAIRSEDAEAAGHANLTLGELAVATGRIQDAQNIFQRLQDHPNPNVRVRAELEKIKLDLQTGDMTYLDASDLLDTLRFRWRGDALELEIVSELATAYFELGRYREAMMLAQNFATQFPDLPGARDLRMKLADQFKALFLEGEADSLDPISALALFYEFRDLTPIGPDGDRMIRLLTNRLVAFDLLDPATELLSHQVDNRNLIGQSRAQIAADLAAIYLLDKRPENALMTLNSTRIAGIDPELRLERRLLEAAAHMELQRFGHAIELLDGLKDPDALELLAEVHWRARAWSEAGSALQRTLPPVGATFSAKDTQSAIRAAVAYRLDGDSDGLADLRSQYLDQMRRTREGDAFDLLTGRTEVSASRLTDTVRRLADTSTADAFLSSIRQRFSPAGGSR